jgi:hypothetical protein
LLGSLPHILEAHRVTITSAGGRHHSQSLCISLTSTSSCLLVNSCFVSFALAIEALIPRKRLLSTDLSTLKILAASEILGLVELLRNAIASSIGAIVAKELSVKMVLFMAAEVCPTQGCARRRETFYQDSRP